MLRRMSTGWSVVVMSCNESNRNTAQGYGALLSAVVAISLSAGAFFLLVTGERVGVLLSVAALLFAANTTLQLGRRVGRQKAQEADS
jgi:hypothetical protein